MTAKPYIHNISIQNFKLFEHITASGFDHVNLIVGSNNAGKTCLLEALFLSLGPTNAELWLNISARRGIDKVNSNDHPANYLFHKLDSSRTIEFLINENLNDEYRLKLDLLEETAVQELSTSDNIELSGDTGVSGRMTTLSTVTFRQDFTPKGEETIVSQATITRDKISFGERLPPIFKGSIYISAHHGFPSSNDVSRYSNLDKANNIPIYENLLRRVVPELRRTSIIVGHGTTSIYADVGFGLIPFSMLGLGSNRFSSLLLSIAGAEDAILLIDEIETGLHYSGLVKLWSAVATFAKDYKCQVFASTHSTECVRAANEIFNISEDEVGFRVHRLDRKEDHVRMTSFDSEQLISALDSGWEIR